MADQEHLNNFEALRIMAAWTVLLDHQYALSGIPQHGFILQPAIGEWAVEVFFAVSGYLVATSLQLDPQPLRFIAKRFLRIWPGLLVVLLLSVVVLGPVMTSVSAAAYWSDTATRSYLTSNLLMRIVYHLPGVFDSNPYPSAVNGSLWTLPYEVRWYLLLAVMAVLRMTRYRWLMACVWAVMYVNYFFVYDVDSRLLRHGDHRYADELGVFFMAGVVLQQFGEQWRARPERIAAALWIILPVVTLLCASERFMAAQALVVPAFAIWFGSSSLPFIRRAGRFGDPSYGIYIYAFVVQQTLVALLASYLRFEEMLLASSVVTVALGYLSWHLIEKPSLSLRSRLKLSVSGAAAVPRN